MAGFKPRPVARPYFSSTAKKSRHKFLWKKFEHPQDDPKADAARVKYMDVFHNKSRSPTNLLCLFNPQLAVPTGTESTSLYSPLLVKTE